MIATTAQLAPVVCNDRHEWLRQRQAVIGASDSAAILGCGYADQSPMTVWHSKIADEVIDDPKKAKLFRVGKLMEPSLRLIFADETGLPCDPAGEFTIYRHPDVPFVGATLDGCTVHDEWGFCPVELKNVSNFNRHDWQDDDHPPLKFNIQCQQQMACTGATHAFLLGLIGGNEPIVKVIERNDRFIDALLKRLDEFWGYVQARELPPIDDKVATGQVLAKLWPKDNGRTVPLPDEAMQWAIDRELAKAVIKQCEGVCTLAENHIKAAIGEGTFGDLPNIADGLILDAAKERFSKIVEAAEPELKPRYSWKEQSRKSYVVEATSYRVLRMTK